MPARVWGFESPLSHHNEAPSLTSGLEVRSRRQRQRIRLDAHMSAPDSSLATTEKREQERTTGHDQEDRHQPDLDLEQLPDPAEEEQHTNRHPEFFKSQPKVPSRRLPEEDDGRDSDGTDALAEIHQKRRADPDEEQAPSRGIQPLAHAPLRGRGRFLAFNDVLRRDDAPSSRNATTVNGVNVKPSEIWE